VCVCVCVCVFVCVCIYIYHSCFTPVFLVTYVIYIKYVYIGVCRVVVLLVERERARRSELCD